MSRAQYYELTPAGGLEVEGYRLPLVITEREDPTLWLPIPPPRANIKCSAGHLDLSDVGLDIHGEANFP